MSNTEERVVNMRFNNSDFKKAAVDTYKALADVNKAVDAAGHTKGLLDLDKQMGAVQVTASKMSVAVGAALGTIAAKATNTALAMASSLSLGPIKEGFSEYEALLTKQNVIMNATGASAKEVTGYLADLNKYSDETIYSFANMTGSIVKFVNAGVPLDQAVVSMKGIANSAAFAGATTEEANRAMYAFSQSMSTGFIMLNDWMQIDNANMATLGFKEQLLEAGVAAGTLTRQGKGFITTSGNFVSATKGWRDGLQDQWATTEVLNNALAKYTDTTTKLGRKATDAAKQVRTFTAFMSTLKESLGSGWATIFESLFGNLKQATNFWTTLSDAVGGAVTGFFSFLGVALKTWRKMGGFEKLLGIFSNLLAPFGALLKAVGDAWAAAFPGSDSGAGKALYGLTAALELITRPLQWLADLISGTTPILTVFFQIIRLGATVIGRVAGLIGGFVKDLLGLADLKAPSGGGFLGFIKDIGKAIGDAVDGVQKLLDKGASLKEAFGSIDINLPSMPGLPDMPDMPSMGGGDEAASTMDKLADGVKDVTANIKDMGSASKDTASEGIFDFGDLMGGLWDFLVKMKDGIANVIGKLNWDDAVSAFNMSIFATMGVAFTRFMWTISKSFEGFMGMGAAMNEIMGDLGGALRSFQTQARAKLILNIAIALLLLAAALWILSKIPKDDLVKALVALGATAFILSKAMKSMTQSITQMDGAKAGIKMMAISIAIMALAAAMILLAVAFILFNKVDFDSVLKGLATMYVAMKMIENLGNISKDSYKNILASAVAITAIAWAMILLAGALLLFKLVDWESMAKGGLVLAAVTAVVWLLAKLPAASLFGVGAAMMGMGLGMVALATALIMFAKVEWGDIKKGAVVLGLLALAVALMMAAGGPTGAAVLVGMGVAMIFLAGALLMLNDVEWASIGKLAVIFTVLSLALLAFTGIMYLMAPVIPVVVLLGLALMALGLGMLAFAGAMAIAISLGAAGVAAFAALATGAAVAVAVFLQTLAKEAPVIKQALLDILQSMIDTLVEAVPMIIDGVQRLWAAIKAEFSKGASKSGAGDSGKNMVQSMGDKIKEKIPMIVQKAKELIIGFLKGLASKVDDLAEAAAGLVAALIRGIARKIDDIVAAAVDLIVNFAQGISDGLPKIIQAGIDLIANFLHDLADKIRNESGKIGSGITDLIDAFFDVGVNLVKGIGQGIANTDISGFIKDLANKLPGWAKKVLKIDSPSKVFAEIGKNVVLGLAKGIADNAGAAIVTVASMLTGTIALANDYVNQYLQNLDQKAAIARGKADGLAAAAQAAADAAGKTKSKADDRAARKMAKAAKAADRKADKAEQKAQAEADRQDRAEEWANASYIEKAEIRSQDAQNQIEASKAAKGRAAAARAEAAALEKQAKKEGLTEKQRKAMRKEADRLREEAKKQDARARELMKAAEGSATDALRFQGLAGDELAAAFQEQFNEEAQADADAAAYEKLSGAEKAAKKRADAAKLEAAAQAALKEAQVLAYTDVEAANEKAQQALEMADLARQYLDEAMDLEQQGGGGSSIELSPTEAAAMAFNDYSDLYDAAVAAAAGNTGPVFNQYNTSPESLTPSEVYRQTNNLLTHAASNLQPAA